MITPTFWNGEPCEARLVTVIVGRAPAVSWWCAELVGTERKAVEVIYDGKTFYLDDDVWTEDMEPATTREHRLTFGMPFDSREPGHAWEKVTTGLGSPRWPHSSLPVKEGSVKPR